MVTYPVKALVLEIVDEEEPAPIYLVSISDVELSISLFSLLLTFAETQKFTFSSPQTPRKKCK